MEKQPKTSKPPTRLLALVFFLSGLASLIYQVVWQRALTLHYGVGSLSITLIVSVYMFGLGIGSLLGGFLAERMKDKITLYFFVELLLGVFGVLSLSFLKFLGERTAGANYLVSLGFMFLFLSAPTLLMGITLPLLTKIYNGLIHNFFKSVSYLYFLNTLGAALGAVFASYVLISFFGLDTAVYVAATINLLLSVLILSARRMSAHSEQSALPPEEAPAVPDEVFGRKAYPLIFVTGFLAIGYELAWFRIITVLLKASPYAFSTALSVYLFGIALGSFAMNRRLAKNKPLGKKNLFYLLQLFIGLYTFLVIVGYYHVTKRTPFSILTYTSFIMELHPTFAIPSMASWKSFFQDLYGLLDVLFWPSLFMFLPTLFMGATFPLMSALAMTRPDREGKTVGTVYCVNIMGNILGGVLTGFVLLPITGTESTLLVFAGLGCIFGLFVTKIGKRKAGALERLAIIALVWVGVISFPRRGDLYDTIHIPPFDAYYTYIEEGVDGVIVTYEWEDEVSNSINGLGHGGRPNLWFYFDAIEAAAYARSAEDVLVIGYGTGSTVEVALRIPEMNKITLVELNRDLLKNLRKMPLFENMLSSPKIDLHIDDARRFLQRTDNKYDLILLDPLRSTTSYSNNLYSIEFCTMMKEHLNPGGVVFLWLDDYKVMPKTLAASFDYIRMYSDFCLGSETPFELDSERREQIVARFPASQQETLREWIESGEEYLGNREYVEEITAGYPINRDWKPVCEYYLGLTAKEAFQRSETGQQGEGTE